ncbi:MAG: hypothetical protein A2527_02425 [Candidatus Lambdaproteobacteria bacterium RIFOXYD2_FULL_50_16]|uniref:DNA methylase N-4/N-6 domain-containing protein n=1 Tax=Candidatus Lambdaproteobacteria bacterium RIFOXYD2_FULL_50_16 TaxID=1817772 RepID=A0A1F6GDY7_9PROT|nr:MAG: hypothetical protein A2527_02425 [Candidatus Lambdaproteobacteria bacterium RIFOXYD2_FULL_50_16]
MKRTLAELQTKLKEIFQMDRGDLDFGVYRIMRLKAKEIEAYLNERLPQTIEEELGKVDQAELEQIKAKIAKIERDAEEMGGDPNKKPEYRELKAKLISGSESETLIQEVAAYLYDFFGQYYDDGDFLSKRRYKKDHYVIPYEGEEVKLHWANQDQYYIKSGEAFRHYAFVLPSGTKVEFRIKEAETEAANNKAQKDREFVLVEGPGALEEGAGWLRLWFEYKGLEGIKKEENLERTLERVGKRLQGPLKMELIEPPADGSSAPLAKHLKIYSARNKFDYFIHKNLAEFLNRELDFYLKNEVLVIDDLLAGAPEVADLRFKKARALKAVANQLIQFLAQLEEFQKKLWLKKKFVLAADYCVTLDHLWAMEPKERDPLLAQVLANELQRQRWVELYRIDQIKGSKNQQLELGQAPSPAYRKPLTLDFLKANPYLALDTALFAPEFKEALLAGIDDLDQKTNGLLIQSENFQALNLLQERYKEQVQCVYIDPPYNTGDDGFPYKDNYQHSSWMSFLMDRLHLGRNLQTDSSAIAISIDDEEVDRLSVLAKLVYGENELAKLIWDRNRKNDATFFSVGHDYMLIYAKSIQFIKDRKVIFREPQEGIEDAKKIFSNLRKKHKDDWEKIREDWMGWFENVSIADPRRRLKRFTKVGIRGPYRTDGNISWPGGGGPKYEIIHPVTKLPVKVPNGGWRYSIPERFWEEYEKGNVVFGVDEKTIPGKSNYLFESDGQVMPSVFYSYAQTATMEFNDIFGHLAFPNPKNWKDISRVTSYLSDRESTILDYFAGSAPTGHAVINLNREDGGQRKYILVEMGEYFETVTKPRVLKAAYSQDWKDGAPIGRQGVSQLVKCLKLESYEDALDNLELIEPDPAAMELIQSLPGTQDEYLLNYMLDLETKGSLLNLAQFKDPFNYQLEVNGQGGSRKVTVDLVETFNYLIGLKVTAQSRQGKVLMLEGLGRLGEKILVLWRNLEEVNNEDLGDLLRKLRIKTKDNELDLIYVNGDNHLENKRRADESWKVRLIEAEFHARMFEGL